jgi:hypothetical protein
MAFLDATIVNIAFPSATANSTRTGQDAPKEPPL